MCECPSVGLNDQNFHESVNPRHDFSGALLIDADKMGHLAYAKGTACLQALVDHFGPAVLDPNSGEIDRRELGAIVFADPAQMQALNGIVWPALRVLLEQELARVKLEPREQQEEAGELEGEGEAAAAGDRRRRRRVVVLEAAVLLEAGWTDLVDEVWAGECLRA